MKNDLLTLLTTENYFSEITRRIAATKQGDRVALMSMGFNPTEHVIKTLFQETIAAAERGAFVQVNIDAHSFMVNDKTDLPTGPIIKHGDFQGGAKNTDFQKKLFDLNKLQAAGGAWQLLNIPSSRFENPYGGRSHIKYTVINDSLYLGGCNLYHAENADAMVRIDEPNAADWVFDFILLAADNGNVRRALEGKDISHEIDSKTSLFIDAGIKHRSKIYEEALKLIDEAKKRLVITCQFFPDSTTARHLSAAVRRGVDVTVYFNTPRQQSNIKPLLMQVIQWREQLRCPPELFKGQLAPNQPFLHAKLLANESAGMIGSHNYVVQGVKFGTAETALLRRDKNFARQIANFAENLAGQA